MRGSKNLSRRKALANSPQSIKRARQTIKRRAHNTSLRSRMRTFIKDTLNAIATGDKDKAAVAYKAAAPEIDKMANKGLIHKNKAARTKSRLNTRLRAM
ncbi:SSU ribosomal protein S20p [hydrothermal vent metagenome]|uniref:SSU ribosomal protein S20p n=1 Tax=hydrothermal vent metagenome TaxID=652676 RepID=A0A3B0ZZ12_9ZZZZ